MNAPTQTICFHCNSEIESESIVRVIKGSEKNFCCNGCAELSSLLLESGLTQFYSIRGTQVLEPVSRSNEEYLNLNSETVMQEYAQELPNGGKSVLISVGGIHCSACTWLIEKVLNQSKGVQEARINFGTGRLKVDFDPKEVHLSAIFQIIQKLGYSPNLYSYSKAESKVEKPYKDLLLRTVVAAFCWGNIMLFSAALYAGYFQGIDFNFKKLLHYVSWIFATPVFIYSGYPFWKGALESWKHRILSMDTLLFLGVGFAYFYSVYVTITDRGEVYFDSVCTIYFFILLGKYLEANIRFKASAKVGELLSLIPEELEAERNGAWEKIPSSSITKGDRLLLQNGTRVPIDGILNSQNAYFDESVLTGESNPIHKLAGDIVRAGSVSLSSTVQISASGSVLESSLTQMSRLLENSLLTKPKVQRTTDKLSSYFVKVVLLVASITFFYWWNHSGAEAAILNTISVLIVACPCALGLSVPAALVVSHLMQSKEGILVKNPESTEILAKADRIIFDKTGTLTVGQLQLSEERVIYPETSQNFREIACSLERNSSHPIAKSFVKAISELQGFKETDSSVLKSEVPSLHDIKELPGFGIEGKNGALYRVGSKSFATDIDSENDGWIYLSKNKTALAAWKFSDLLRTDAKKSISELQKDGVKLEILSGDNKDKVELVARELGISEFKGNLLPEEKKKRILEAQSSGETVVVVGDGINDSLCIAQANLGISMGVGSDLSLDKSDMILVSNKLESLPKGLKIAKATKRVILQNIIVSLIYNSVMIPIAAFGFMLPVICAGFMTASSLSVVLNSALLTRRVKR
ncbi:copper-translocating P-type ATPase [Leptospira perolatii]|uniref:Copper-translocating P-type ATPase n=1 Tax=Leptospira perolatii TaxID=2023191 RepID=A0A2M9ZQE8_9LEPT|nr:heavy metal translocating P-type ATPase [Leptospira perolatii]PJZ70456.1 copper-translocating P-type ATPase [Leptospira perolatii]PJZ74292.1 copper-translocating P-type ATPase [Leptospira perolatii]